MNDVGVAGSGGITLGEMSFQAELSFWIYTPLLHSSSSSS